MNNGRPHGDYRAPSSARGGGGRRPRDRGNDRQGPAGGANAGDEDYDWYRYLGEGKSASGLGQEPPDWPGSASNDRLSRPARPARDSRPGAPDPFRQPERPLDESAGRRDNRDAWDDRDAWPGDPDAWDAPSSGRSAPSSRSAVSGRSTPLDGPGPSGIRSGPPDGHRSRARPAADPRDRPAPPPPAVHRWRAWPETLDDSDTGIQPRWLMDSPPSARPDIVAKPSTAGPVDYPDGLSGDAGLGSDRALSRPAAPGRVTTPGRVATPGRPAAPPSRGAAPVTSKPAKVRKQARPARPRKPARRPGSGRALTRGARRLPRRVLVASGSAIIAVLGVAAYFLLTPPPVHVVTLPATLNGYVRQPASASATALQMRNRIVSQARGEVSHVVAAVYERTTGPGTSAGPQVVVFIGGNLTGGSSFISGFMAEMRGAVPVNPGKLGGQAACAPGSGGPAECAWADNDTFGVIVSATLSVSGLAQEMQLMRPLVEHVVS
jgi:hypothetical protein